MLKGWLRALGLTQRRCALCLAPYTAPAAAPPALPAGLCPACATRLAPYAGPRCPRCGLPPAAPEHGEGVCGACLQNPPPWDGVAFHGLYRDALRLALLRLKFDGHLYLAPVLGALLLAASETLPRPDAVVAVPQHPDHLRQRGYNQAHELARALCARARLPLRTDLLRRTAPGPAQTSLRAGARQRNVRHSFAARYAQGLRIWLVDDVMTTGSTLRAATLALRLDGAARVDIVFAARTPSPQAGRILDNSLKWLETAAVNEPSLRPGTRPA